MIKITYEYFTVFNKIVWSEKIPFIYSLVFPLIAFFLTNYSWISSPPETAVLLAHLNIYWAFIIFGVFLNGLGLQLSSFRESGFLKTSAMISGSKYPIFAGMALTQFCFAFASITIFTTIIGLLVGDNIFLLLSIGYLILLLTSIPMILFVSWIPVLPTRQNTIGTISNIVLLPMVFISASRPLSDNFYIETIFSFVPIDYITQVGILVKRIIFNEAFDYSYIPIIIGTIAYLFIGLFFVKRIKLVSTLSRH